MNLYFKILLLISILSSAQMCYSRDVVIISYDKSMLKVEQVRNIIINKLQIPKQLIAIKKNINACEKISSAIIQICVSNNNKITFPILNKKVLAKTFQVFMRKDNI